MSPSTSVSPSASRSPSASASGSPSASRSPSTSISASPSAPVTGHGQIFIAKGEDATWTACTGKYFDPSAKAHFSQVQGKILITNGVDPLCYLNISTSTVVPYVLLDTPSAPTLTTLTGLTGSDYKITYRVTANSTVGETAASSALSQDVLYDRDFWDPTTMSVKIGWSAVTNATSYNVYMGTVAGSEYLIASGLPPDGLVYTDDGSAVQDYTRPFPTINSTEGPVCQRSEIINGRAFLIGDADDPYLVRWGGDPGYELDFSPANGGGYVPIGSGTKEVPVAIKSFRDGKGTAQITVLSRGSNGDGKRYTMTPDQITLGSTIITFYAVTEDNGREGTDSPDAVISYGDSLHYPSRDGFKTTGTKPSLQNLLSTDRTSNTIQNDLTRLNSDAMENAVGLGYEGRLYWCLPVSADYNNEIWVLDLDRKGAWMKPWGISADWMLLYNDNSGETRHLVLSDNKIYALSYASLTSDDGTPFLTGGQSGQIYFSDDKRMWAQLLQVVIVLLRPQGEITFTITGKTEDNPTQVVGDPQIFESFTTTSVGGWGEPGSLVGWGKYAWSQIGEVPTNQSEATQEVNIEIDEEVQWASYSWSSVGVGTDYNISDVIFEYVETGIKDLS